MLPTFLPSLPVLLLLFSRPFEVQTARPRECSFDMVRWDETRREYFTFTKVELGETGFYTKGVRMYLSREFAELKGYNRHVTGDWTCEVEAKHIPSPLNTVICCKDLWTSILVLFQLILKRKCSVLKLYFEKDLGFYCRKAAQSYSPIWATWELIVKRSDSTLPFQD